MIEYLKNLNTEKIIEKIKPLAVAALCLTAVFAAGYGVGKSSGTGSSNGGSGATKRSLNYTTPTAEEQNGDDKPVAAATQTAQTPPDPNNCYIKGSKSKTYHVPGGAFYDRTTPAACFNTEEEAQAAGYKKSSR